MKNNYLQIISRQFRKNRLYLIVNILSISIAVTIALLVYSFVVKEIKTDRFHTHSKYIFRILTKDTPSASYQAHHFGVLGPTVSQQVSGIEAFARTWELSMQIKTMPGQTTPITEKCLYADTSFFKIFTFPQILGYLGDNPSYQWAVISAKAAQKYFGDTNPIGKNLYLQDKLWSRQPQTYQIVAVMDNIPAWSTIQANIILDYRYMEQFTNWKSNMQTITYVQLTPQTSVTDTEENIRQAYSNAFPEFQGTVKLQPLQDIYYNKDQVHYFNSTEIPQGSLLFTRLIIGITLLILFLVSCSYILIKIVQSQHNLKLFALQRCFGAAHFTIWKYFLTETAIYFIFSGLLGVFFAILFFQSFQNVVTPEFRYPFPLNTMSIIGFLSLLTIFILFITAILTTYFLKRLKSGIKENLHTSRSSLDLRKALAFISIAIFCLLFMDASIVNQQMHYLKNKDLGFNVENTLTVRGSNSELKTILQECPYISSVSLGAMPLPWTNPSFFKLFCQFKETGKINNPAEIVTGDAHFLETYQIPLLEGENFDPDTKPRQNGVIPLLVNQEFVKQSGLKQAVSTIFQGRLSDREDGPLTTFQIIGIVKDFHFRSLYEAIPPLVICYSKGSQSQGFMNNDITAIRYIPGKRSEVMSYLQDNHISFFHEYNYDQLYRKEKSLIRIVNIAACLALLIGGFGIFAFAVFYANSRKKEVALRKINGGSIWEIQQLFHREFIKITIGAYLVTMPVAYYLIQNWLQKFTYKISIEWYIFAGVLLICLLLVMLIITWQIWHTTHLNPVECLQEE